MGRLCPSHGLLNFSIFQKNILGLVFGMIGDAVSEEKVRWRGATMKNTLHGSSTEEQQGQPAVWPKTFRAAGVLAVGELNAIWENIQTSLPRTPS
jgi:hypothetical protein